MRLAVVPEDLGGWFRATLTPAPGYLTLSSDLCGYQYPHTCTCAHAHKQRSHLYKNTNVKTWMGYYVCNRSIWEAKREEVSSG